MDYTHAMWLVAYLATLGSATFLAYYYLKLRYGMTGIQTSVPSANHSTGQTSSAGGDVPY